MPLSPVPQRGGRKNKTQEQLPGVRGEGGVRAGAAHSRSGDAALPGTGCDGQLLWLGAMEWRAGELNKEQMKGSKTSGRGEIQRAG